MISCAKCGYPFLVGLVPLCATCEASHEDGNNVPRDLASASVRFPARHLPRVGARRDIPVKRAARKLALQLLVTLASLPTIPAAACDIHTRGHTMQRTYINTGLFDLLSVDLEDLAAPLTANLTPRAVREHAALALRALYGDLDACERDDLR